MKKEELPLISFCMPVYHDGDTVTKAVESILDQDYPEIEVILSVDGCEESAKAVKKIVAKYKSMKRGVSAIYSKKNQGACIARNDAAKLAKGKYLSFLPADGYLLPGVVRIWMKHLEEHPDYDFLYGGYRFLNEIYTKKELEKFAKKEKISITEFIERNRYYPLPDDRFGGQQGFDYMSDNFDPYFLDTTNYIDGSFPLTKKKFDEIGGWDPKIKSLQDWDLWLSVVKSGGKGIFVKDIFFETEYPHPGGLSHDSSKNWLQRLSEIKKKHKIEERTTCVTSLGAKFHAKRLAYILGADFKEMPSFKPHNYEMIYLIGFYPQFADECAQVFQNCRGTKVIHWVGSDIWQMQQMDLQSRHILLDYFKKNVDHHLCEAEFTKKELKELGVDARVIPLPPIKLFKPTPLPNKFKVAVYMPHVNENFYRPDMCEKIAELCPDIEFVFFGNQGRQGKDKNIEYAGYITDMQKFIGECSALMRLTIHDGLPITALEFLTAGRNVLASVPIKHATHIEKPTPELVAAELKKMKRLGLNVRGSKSWMCALAHSKFKKKINKLKEYDPKEYWERRADSWSELADLNYSLPITDKNLIKNWINKLEFKSVLDIGCGNGRFTPMFIGKDYTGIDISDKLVKIAKKRFPESEFKTMRVEDLKPILSKPKYDLIFSYTCLEHIIEEDFPKAVEALKKVGKKILLIEPEGFESVGHCHDHDYKKHFKVIKKKKLSDKTMYLCEL